MLSEADRLFLSELIRGLPWVAGVIIVTVTIGFWLRFDAPIWSAF